MTAIYELRLWDQAGVRVATFDQWPDLVAEVGVNRPAVYALRLDGDDDRTALFEHDGLLEMWWADHDHGIAWRREFTAFCIDRRQWTDDKGARHFLSSGMGLESRLSDPGTIIDVAAGDAASRKSGVGETVLKAWVDQEAGPGAGARARPGLSIEADAGLGGAWSGQRSNRGLLGVLQQIAEATGVQFGITRTGAFTFEFRVWEPTDRSASVIFAEERGNMGRPEVRDRQSEVANSIKALGEGEGAARRVQRASDAGSIALSPWGRKERAVSVTDQDADADLLARAEAELDKNRALTGFSFQPLQTPGCLYGLHYFLGDTVTARYGGSSYTQRIDVVRWRITGQERRVEIETIEA